MPYGKKNYSKFRKTNAKPSMGKAKAMVSKAKAKQRKYNLDTFSLKCRSEYLVHPQQGVAVSNYIYGGTQLLGSNLLQNADFTYFRLQYDKFRINSVKCTWMPKANVFPAGDAQADAIYKLTGDGLIHTAIDRDGPIPSNTSTISRAPSYKAFSLLKRWSRTYRISYPKNIWLDTADPTSTQNVAITNTLGMGGGVYYYAEDVIEDIGEVANEPVAMFIMEFNVVFQGKTSAPYSFSVDENGKVLSATITAPDTDDNKPFSLTTGQRGYIQDTRLISTTDEENGPYQEDIPNTGEA